MRRSKRHLDQQIDRLLAGDEVPEIGDGIADLVSRLQQKPSSGRETKELVSSLAIEASRSESVPARTRFRAARPLPTRWRRRIMLSTFLSSLFGKLAIGAVALATTTSGLAATGNLPDPAQDWASEQLNEIGIEIPNSDDAEREDNDVLDVIESGDPSDGDEFGKDVADTASDGKSSDGLDTADDAESNADVADEFAEDAEDNAVTDLPDEADQGADNADTETPEEAGEGADNAGNTENADNAENADGNRP